VLANTVGPSGCPYPNNRVPEGFPSDSRKRFQDRERGHQIRSILVIALSANDLSSPAAAKRKQSKMVIKSLSRVKRKSLRPTFYFERVNHLALSPD
jgi:hypothetical protein